MDENMEEIESLLRELESAEGLFSTAAAEMRPYSSRARGCAETNRAAQPRATSSANPVGRALFSSYAPPADDEGHSSHRVSIPLGKCLSPLRPVTQNAFGAAVPLESPQASAARGILAQRVSHDEARQTAALLRGGEGHTWQPQERAGGDETQPALSVPPEDGGVFQEGRILPLMCARYMNPAGILPRPCWGHTLTAMNSGKLLMFGGMDVDRGAESALLFEYDTHHVAWDPVYVAGGTPPAPRSYHAACAHESRWLYISGGMRECGTRVLGDLHCYDTHTQEWTCLWTFSGASSGERNEPTPRFGHTMIIYEDRLYIFGGRTARRDESEVRSSIGRTNSDVYVFSLSARKWRKRIRGAAKQTCAEPPKPFDAVTKRSESPQSQKTRKLHRPLPRFHHAAAVLQEKMFINGGLDENTVLSDTWALDLKKRTWEMLHDDSNADAFPRERHHLFASGDALLVVGGCSPNLPTSRIALRHHNFVAVLPLAGDVAPCWIPVSIGNVSLVSPSKKSFGAAFSGGFVHVFGGVSGAGAATNTMIRFLAADGFVSPDTRASESGTKSESLRAMMRKVREGGGGAGFDAYAIPRVWDTSTAVQAKDIRSFGVHRALVQQRAPKFWEDLSRCRAEPLRAIAQSTVEDVSAELVSGEKEKEKGEKGTTSASHHAVVYYTEGNSRVHGLSVPLTSDQLQDLLDYIYWGGMRFRPVLDDDDDDEEEAGGGGEKNTNNNNKDEEEDEEEEVPKESDGKKRKHRNPTAVSASHNNGSGPNVSPRSDSDKRSALQALRHAAEVYELRPLADLCESLLQRSSKRLRASQAQSFRQLQSDLAALLESGAGASMTVLFVDPHTKQRAVHALHPFILSAASAFFSDLLRPLLSGHRSLFQIGPVVAKIAGGNTRRGLLVGPVSLPALAVQPLLRFLYTQELRVPREAAFAAMLGSHLLDIAPLQLHCESILAREEVNYDTAAEFYSLAGKYEAPLLQETALLTAVLGYAEVRQSAGFKSLRAKEREAIESVANELGAGAWTAPTQVASTVKPAETYRAQWNASAQ